MSEQLFDILKWVLGVPAAIITFITIPYVFQKQRLEIKKLKIEVQQLQGHTPTIPPKKKFWLLSFFTWLAPYWLPLIILQGLILIGVALWKWNPTYAFGGFISFSILLAVGAMIDSYYGPFDLKRKS